MFRQCEINSERYSSVTPINIGDENCASGHTFGPAVRMHWLIHYVVSGKGNYSVNGRMFEVSAGEAFVIRPGEVTAYSADKDDPWHYVWVAFSAKKLMFETLPYVISDSGFTMTMQKIDSMYVSGAEVNDFIAASAVWDAVAALLRAYGTKDGINYSIAAVNIIKKQYVEGINVTDVARQLGLDRCYLSHIFKAELGVSPGRFLLAYRMERALELLEKETFSVSVISNSVGYKDIYTFSRAFKQHFGVPPMEWKKIGSHVGAYCKLYEE